MQNIKNVIFDLGGVVLDIDFKRTDEAFRQLGLENFFEHISPTHITHFFEEYETGVIDDVAFLKGVAGLVGKKTAEKEIIAAWNALLLDFLPERIELLKNIKSRYRTFLLSNTNSLHHQEYQQRLFTTYGIRLEDLFEKTYYSHTARLRKPHGAIFDLVLKENGLVPEETLFIDDTAANLPEAEQMGIRVHHLVPGSTITELALFK